MSVKRVLRTLLVCLPLAFGSIMGVPMRPEEIEELMHCMNEPRIVVTIPGDSESGDEDKHAGKEVIK